MQVLMNSNPSKADHLLYRVYYSLMASDILHKLGFDATQENKKILHEFHKRVLGYKSIADASHETVSHFLRDVGVFWAERGVFVRSSVNQPFNLQDMPLSELWDVL